MTTAIDQPQELAAAVARTLLHAEDSTARAADARRQVATHHAAASMAASYEEIYRALVSSPRS